MGKFVGIKVATGQPVDEQPLRGCGGQRCLVAELHFSLLDQAQHDGKINQRVALGQAHGQRLVSAVEIRQWAGCRRPIAVRHGFQVD